MTARCMFPADLRWTLRRKMVTETGGTWGTAGGADRLHYSPINAEEKAEN